MASLLIAVPFTADAAAFVSCPSKIRTDRRPSGTDRLSSPTDTSRTCLNLSSSSGGFGKASSEKNYAKKKKGKARIKNTAKSRPPPYTPDTTDSTARLLEWLEEEEVEGLENVEIGMVPSPTGDGPPLRGLFARRDIFAGEYLVAVPFLSTLLVHEEFEASSPGTEHDPSDHLLASKPENGLRFWKRFLKDPSGDAHQKYKAYLDCLPMSTDDPNFDATPDFWTDEEIEQLPFLAEDARSRKQAIQNLVAEYKHDARVTSSIQQACWLVQTRGFSTYKKAVDLDGQEGLLSRVVLIPMLDMINHGGSGVGSSTNAELQVVETKAYDESFYALIASKLIPKGSEIRICYGTGRESSLDLFFKYGFLPSQEINEELRKVDSLIQKQRKR